MSYRVITDKDRQYLFEHGYTSSDIGQLEEAARIKNTKYYFTNPITNTKTKISRKEALRILGRKAWLSGLGRSAFHYTSVREGVYKKGNVYFDSFDLFNKQ